MLLSTISNILASANDFNLTSVFFKLPAKLIQMLNRNEQDPVHKCQDIGF